MMTMQSPTQRANRRRLLVFLGVFLPVALAGLIYTYARPPEYRASARVQINAGAVQVESVAPVGGSQGVDAPRPFMAELQVLTSRPVVEATIERLRETMGDRIAARGADPVATLQDSLSSTPAGGTDIVELAAVGPDPVLAAALVNGVVVTYGERLERSYQSSSNESLLRAVDEVAKLEAGVLAKRREIEDFRIRHNIVSLERDENEALARARGLTTALNNATEKQAAAEGKLRSLTDSAKAGRPLTRDRNNTSLANLEQRASQIREELSEQRRAYTDDYLALDNRVRAQRARLAELERQIAAQREIDRRTAIEDQQAALADAREEAAAARDAVDRIQQQIVANRGSLQQFSARFNQYKNLTAELAPLESLHRDALQRKARLEAGEKARRPSVRVIEEANVPQQAWRPDYTRDAGIALAAALLSALLVMWVVELFNRADPQPTLLVPQPMGYPMMGAATDARLALGGRQAVPALELDTGGVAGPAKPGLLAAPLILPRELRGDEVRALLAASTPEARVAALLLLHGVTPEELLALRWEDVDAGASKLLIRGASPRALALAAPAVAALGELPKSADGFVMSAAGARALTQDELATELLCAAHDGGVERPAEVTPQSLWHSYVAFLARQGIRMSDLGRLVGRLAPEQAAAYSALAPQGKRLGLAEIRVVMDGVDADGVSADRAGRDDA